MIDNRIIEVLEIALGDLLYLTDKYGETARFQETIDLLSDILTTDKK